MAELSKVFQELNYAETIDYTFEGLGLTVTIAEAHPIRNRAYATALFRAVQKEGVAGDRQLPRAAFIDVVVKTLLRDWNAKRDGADLPVSEALGELTKNADRGGFEICSTIEFIARQSELFKGGASKKKPSSTTSRKARSSATKRKSSRTKPKPAASQSQRASKSS